MRFRLDGCSSRSKPTKGTKGLWAGGEPVVEGRAATVAGCVEELSDYLIGCDPRNIEDLWQVMYRGGFYRGGPILRSAIAGIDQALWDIKGKACGMSVAQLLGGQVRDRIKVYSWIGGDPPADTAVAAQAAADRGFSAIKMNATGELQIVDNWDKVQAALDRVAAVRDAVPELGIAVDFHGRVHKPMAKVLLKELEPYRLMFIEEPVLSEHLDSFLEPMINTATPIALGERLYSRWDFTSILASGAVDIIQPDPSHAGGITETRKIATMAEAYDVAVALHCPLGPIALATASRSTAAPTYNAFIQEQSLGIHYNVGNDLLDYLTDRSVFDYADGFVTIPTGPGLGIEINEDYVVELAQQGHRWRNPVWRHADGSIAEW
jgi:galactonate dehydratase